MAKISGKQVAKSIVYTAIGATPGLTWFIMARTPQSMVITCLCSFVAFMLSLPGVSAARVAGGTVGMIVARNVPSHMQEKVLETFVGKNEPPDEPSD